MDEAGLACDPTHRGEDRAIVQAARRVSPVTGRIGGPADVAGGHLREHFAAEAKGTRAEGAMVEVVAGPRGWDALGGPHAMMDLLPVGVDAEGGL